MKKILNIIAQRPDKTGSGMYLQALVKEGDKKNYEQAVVAGVPVNYEGICFDIRKPIKFYPVIFETKELSFPVVGMSDVMPYESTRYKDMSIEMFEVWKNSFSKAVFKAVSEFEPDVIICHHLWILTALVKEMYPDKNILAFCHGTDLRQLEQFKRIDSSFSKEITKYVIKNCRNLEKIIVSQGDEKELVSEQYGIDKKRIEIAGTGFNPEIFYMNENRHSDDRIRIIYAGKLSYSKGVVSLLNAIKLLDMDYSNVEVYLAGSGTGQEADNIIHMCKKYPYKASIHILGALPQTELAEFFRRCDVFVLPSFYEGLPLVLMEAMACGLKIVVTDLPGVKEWMGEIINNSKIIEYIKLPRLKNADIPVEEDLNEFENNLYRAIKKQIENKTIVSDEVKAAINKKSWESAFYDIERLFV